MIHNLPSGVTINFFQAIFLQKKKSISNPSNCFVSRVSVVVLPSKTRIYLFVYLFYISLLTNWGRNQELLSLLCSPCLSRAVSLLFRGSERETRVMGGGLRGGFAFPLTDFPTVTSTYLTRCLGNKRSFFRTASLSVSADISSLSLVYFFPLSFSYAPVLPFPLFRFPFLHRSSTVWLLVSLPVLFPLQFYL